MRNPHREQILGGKSGRAWKGLENAFKHSRGIIEIIPEDPNTDGKEPEEVGGDDNDGGAKEPEEML